MHTNYLRYLKKLAVWSGAGAIGLLVLLTPYAGLAQTTAGGTATTPLAVPTTINTGTSVTSIPDAPASVGTSIDAASTASTQTTASNANAPTMTGADPTSGFNGFLDFILKIFAFLVYISGTALNVAAYWTIVKMGTLVGQMTSLTTAWIVFRDLGNIVLIFGFIFMGIATILDIQSYGAKKMLVTLLLVAVTINFSLFASRAIVDMGNIFGLQFYKAMNNGQIPTGGLTDNGISDNLMEAVKLSALYHTNSGTKFENQWLVAILGIILFIVVTFVFISITLMLVSRFVILIFLMTISPLAFAAMVIPKFGSQAKKWWETLINNTIFAPLMLLLLLVSLQVIRGGNTLATTITGGTTQYSDVAGSTPPDAAWPGLIILFAITCGFFMASLLIAKQLSAFGAKKSIGFAKGLAGATLGLGASRLTGAAGYGLSKLNDRMHASKAGQFVRSIPVLGALSSLADYTTQKGANSMKKAKFGNSLSTEENRKWEKERKDELKKVAKEVELEKIKKAFEAANITLAKGGTTEEIKAAEEAKLASSDKIAEILSTMSDKEIASLDGIKKGQDALVNNLSPEQFASLMKDGSGLSEVEKTRVKTARFKQTNEKLGKLVETMKNNPPGSVPFKQAAAEHKKAVREIPQKDLENAPAEFLEGEGNLKDISNDTRINLIKSGKMGPAITRRLKELDPTEIVKKAFASGDLDATVDALGTDMRPEAVAKLPFDLLSNERVMQSLTPAMLGAMSNELDAKQRKVIAEYFKKNLADAAWDEAEGQKRYFSNSLSAVWGSVLSMTTSSGSSNTSTRTGGYTPPGGKPSYNRPV